MNFIIIKNSYVNPICNSSDIVLKAYYEIHYNSISYNLLPFFRYEILNKPIFFLIVANI